MAEKKVSRKQLVKGGAGGALALGALAAAGPAGARTASGRDARHVHIHGVLFGVFPTPAAARLAVSLDVAGRPDDLAGMGWDSGITAGPTQMKPTGNYPVGPVGACIYTANGAMDDRTVTLVGTSLLTNRPHPARADSEDPTKSDTRADGRNFNGSADVDTGDITFSLSPDGGSFAGKGTVVVTHASRASKQ